MTGEGGPQILNRLCQRIAWPSDLIVPAGDHMEVRETSRPVSPFLLNHDQIGHQVNWVLSAVRRAYLALCPEEEKQSLLICCLDLATTESARFGNWQAQSNSSRETRKRGYGTRDPSLIGGFFGRAPYDDGLAAFALPLRQRERCRWHHQSCLAEEGLQR